MCVRATLVLLLLFIATVEASEGKVTFWQEEFTMTCPEVGDWFNKSGETSENGKTYKLTYDGKNKGLYHCEYQKEEVKLKYYFYVKGKVCHNCFELDATLFGLAVVVDVLLTAIVMMIIFKYTKKKSSAGLTAASKAPARPGGRPPPPVRSPDYEQLSTHTRSQDPYSFLNRTG